MYLPLHNASDRKYLFRVPITKLGIFTVSLPLFSFILCVVITMLKDFSSANNTHCNVPNIFPSISASIGNYEPQKTLWRTAIYVHAPFRFFIVFLRWEYYSNIIRQNCILIVKMAVFLNVIENLSLLGLTHWTSSLNYRKYGALKKALFTWDGSNALSGLPNQPLSSSTRNWKLILHAQMLDKQGVLIITYHEVCFKTFIGTSIFYMFFVYLMLTKYRRRATTTQLETFSMKLKWRAFVSNVTSFAFAAYFFLRHNRLCEPYVYSLFGFAEYIFVISNMIFHMTTVYDLKAQFLYLTKKGILIE